MQNSILCFKIGLKQIIIHIRFASVSILQQLRILQLAAVCVSATYNCFSVTNNCEVEITIGHEMSRW